MPYRKKLDVICHEVEPCFAQSIHGERPKPDRNGYYKCRLLSSPYPPSVKCPFRKPDKEITNGIRYPYNEDYGKDTQDNDTGEVSRIE